MEDRQGCQVGVKCPDPRPHPQCRRCRCSKGSHGGISSSNSNNKLEKCGGWTENSTNSNSNSNICQLSPSTQRGMGDATTGSGRTLKYAFCKHLRFPSKKIITFRQFTYGSSFCVYHAGHKIMCLRRANIKLFCLLCCAPSEAYRKSFFTSFLREKKKKGL